MRCAQVLRRLDAHVAHALSLPDRRALDAHLDGCARCRAELASLQRLRTAAAALPRSIEPPADLWPAIDRRLDAAGSTTAVASRPPRWRRLALAAGLVAAVAAGSSGLTAWLLRDGAPAPSGPAVLAAEAQYASAAAELETLLRAREPRLSAGTIAVLERNLRVIDEAIAEARAAVAKDPANTALTDRLLGVHALKLDLLQRVVKL